MLLQLWQIFERHLSYVLTMPRCQLVSKMELFRDNLFSMLEIYCEKVVRPLARIYFRIFFAPLVDDITRHSGHMSTSRVSTTVPPITEERRSVPS
jgi:hypothetical protein